MSSQCAVGLRNKGGAIVPGPVDLLRKHLSADPATKAVTTHKPHVEDGSHSLPRLEVRPSPGKGLGLFTCDNIPAYTRIVDDDALLSLAKGEDLPELSQKYVVLPPDDKQTFDSLSFPASYHTREDILMEKLKRRGLAQDEATWMSQISSRFQANAFKTETSIQQHGPGDYGERRWAYALFPTVARINHSCVPNSHPHYSHSSGTQILYTLSDVEAGAEITISYFDPTMPLGARQERAGSWGFACSCAACSTEGQFEGGQYERAIALVHRTIKTEIGETESLRDAANEIEDTKRAIGIASDPQFPWLVAALPVLYKALGLRAQLANQQRPDVFDDRPSEVQSSFWKAYQWETRITGSHSLQSQQYWESLERYTRNFIAKEALNCESYG